MVGRGHYVHNGATPQDLIVLVAVSLAVTLAARRGEPYRSVAALGGLALLGATRVISLVAAVFVAAFSGISHLVAYVARKRNEDGIHDYALKRGVRIDEVERDLPYVSRSHDKLTLRRGRCSRYAIPRSGNAAPETWAFLMRTKKDGAQFPHGYLFHSAGGEPPAEMAKLLTKIARDSDQEYLEIEATRSELFAYWDAWGGEKQFDRLLGVLQSLAAF